MGKCPFCGKDVIFTSAEPNSPLIVARGGLYKYQKSLLITELYYCRACKKDFFTVAARNR